MPTLPQNHPHATQNPHHLPVLPIFPFLPLQQADGLCAILAVPLLLLQLWSLLEKLHGLLLV